MCRSCREKRTEEMAKDRQFYAEHGICPRCHKNKLFGDEKVCPECKAENTNRIMLKRKDRIPEYNAYMRDYLRKEHHRRIAEGICTRCGKRKADSGYKTCGNCRSKETRKKQVRNYQPLTRYERGLCKFCDNPVEAGYKVCEQHHKMLIERSRSAKAVEARKEWEKDNRLVFKRK